jgi:hypothetical protein
MSIFAKLWNRIWHGPRYEYLIIPFSTPISLDPYGKSGWKLVAVLDRSNIAIFIRPL